MRKHKLLSTVILSASLAFALQAFAFSYSTSLKNARQDQITTAIDAGPSAGKVEIGPAGMGSVCVTFTLSDPSAAASSGGVWTMSGAPKSATASGTCTAAEARIRTSDNTDVITGLTVTATGGGGNITLDNTSINTGQTVNLTGLTFTSGN
jgi:hypothetical protein